MAGIFDADKSDVIRVTEVGETIITAQSLDVPFTRLAPRGAAPQQMLASYPAQVYDPQAFGGVADGADQTTFAHTNRLAIQATGMWLRTAGWLVSKIANLTRAAGVGVGKEVAKQRMDDGLKLGQMIERALLSNMDCVIGAGQTPYQLRGLLQWLLATAQGVLPVNASLRPAAAANFSAALSTLTPTAFRAILRAMYTQKMGPVDVTNFCGIALKSRMSMWAERDTDVASETMIRGYNLDASDRTFESIVDVFKFDEGMVRNVLSNYLACDPTTGLNTDESTRSGALVDLDMYELCWLQKPQDNELPDLGGGRRGMHDAVLMAKMLNPLGQGRIFSAAD